MRAPCKPIPYRGELREAGFPRPAQPAMVWAEDLASLIIRNPRRLRIARGRIRVLS